MKALTVAVRAVGDLFASLMPIIAPMLDQFAQVFGVVAKAVVEVIAAMSPLLGIFSALMPLVQLLAEMFKLVAQAVAAVVAPIAELLGGLLGSLGKVLAGALQTVLPII